MAHIQVKTKGVTIKLTPEQYRIIAQRSEQCGVRMSTWMRAILLQAGTSKADKGYLRIREPEGELT